MTQQSEQYYSDEIDLGDLIRAFWRGKWLVIGVTLATLALGIAYLGLIPKSYTASLEIRALPFSKIGVYEDINELGFISPFNSKSLLSNFIDDLKSHDSFEQAIKAQNYITQQEDETDKAFAFRIKETALKLIIRSDKDIDSVPIKVLEVTTQKPKLIAKVIINALDQSNHNVNNFYESMFRKQINRHNQKSEDALVNIENLRQRAIIKFDSETSARMEHVTEQAKIARALDLKTGTLRSQVLQNNSAVLNMSNSDSPLYLMGYLALEKELELIQSRKSSEVFSKELMMLEDQKLEILKNQTIPRATRAFSFAPIGTDQFSAADYHLAKLKISGKTKKTALILALSIVLGGMLGIFVLLIRNVLVKKD
jgi:chain length determinant protein (polysaccharide antigen chain regulator)